MIYKKKNITLFYQYNIIHKIKFNLYLIKLYKLYKNKILAIFYHYFYYLNYFFFIASKNVIN